MDDDYFDSPDYSVPPSIGDEALYYCMFLAYFAVVFFIGYWYGKHYDFSRLSFPRIKILRAPIIFFPTAITFCIWGCHFGKVHGNFVESKVYALAIVSVIVTAVGYILGYRLRPTSGEPLPDPNS
jgi:hypothetical protein